MSGGKLTPTPTVDATKMKTAHIPANKKGGNCSNIFIIQRTFQLERCKSVLLWCMELDFFTLSPLDKHLHPLILSIPQF